ncbi:hypothetical protein FJTKL_12784 [Diaporthe vaccinii]|uniref:Uncharacterized protein n=1 Tax=Diaporthe vaccinii TaxID=105482 RepID=A0ABR4ECK1_9PEZI
MLRDHKGLSSTLSVSNRPVRNQAKTLLLPQTITIGSFTQQNITNMASEAQVIGGHKANLHNPNTSAEAKEHSKEVLKEDFNVIVDGNKTKDLSHVEAGLKGAMHNENLPVESQFAAAEKLGEIKK